MAYFTRKPDRDGHPRYVFIYIHENGKNVPLPRAQTRHLDGQPDHNIQAWIAQHVDVDRVADDAILWSDDTLRSYLNKFRDYLDQQGKSRATVVQHLSLLERHVVPYFLGLDPPQKDPNHWPAYSLQMRDWLMGREVPGSIIFRINVALRKFFTWLREERYVLPDLVLHLRRPTIAKSDTPLRYTATPGDILTFVQTSQNPTVKLLALLGYFFSLRSQETLALQKEDFRAGSKVLELDCAKAMAEAGLFNRLAVKVSRQRNGYNKLVPTKTLAARAWASCFDERAARELIAILQELPSGLLFPKHHSRYYFTLWKQEGVKGMSLKDLRRASLYWLGHFSKLSLIQIMKHARHTNSKTTELYLRRPDEDLEAQDTLDLDL